MLTDWRNLLMGVGGGDTLNWAISSSSSSIPLCMRPLRWNKKWNNINLPFKQFRFIWLFRKFSAPFSFHCTSYTLLYTGDNQGINFLYAWIYKGSLNKIFYKISIEEKVNFYTIFIENCTGKFLSLLQTKTVLGVSQGR